MVLAPVGNETDLLKLVSVRLLHGNENGPKVDTLRSWCQRQTFSSARRRSQLDKAWEDLRRI